MKGREDRMDNLIIRNADMEDLAQILPIYAKARQFMRENGNPTQWADNFPPEDLLRKDIEKRQLYVLEADEVIHGVFAFIIGKDATYEVIEQGEWKSQSEYGTIHRVAGDGTVHGILDKVIAFCKTKMAHLRIDTHENNQVMRHLIEKNGFSRCGIIHVADGSPRVAYEIVSAEQLS